MASCTHPGTKRLFCPKAKNGLIMNRLFCPKGKKRHHCNEKILQNEMKFQRSGVKESRLSQSATWYLYRSTCASKASNKVRLNAPRTSKSVYQDALGCLGEERAVLFFLVILIRSVLSLKFTRCLTKKTKSTTTANN